MVTMLLPLLSGCHTVSAVSVTTSSFDLHYVYDSSSQYQWKNGILYGSSNGTTVTDTGGINIYQFTTSSIQAGGSSASIHFETNIVSTWYFDYAFNPWVNLDQQNVIVCNSSPSAATTISRNLSTATTLWGNRQANTLTLYGDVTVSGLTAGTTYQFVCAVGSDSYSFYDINSTIGASNVWFEQNPMTISWFTDESQALMQTQINQNQTIINQNETIINQDNQDRQDLQDQTDDSSDTADDLSDDVSDASSSLLVIIGNFVNIVLNPPQSNCNITLDVGNANFGQADLCRLSLPQPLAVLGTLFILGFIITFTVSLIMTFLSLLKGATQG